MRILICLLASLLPLPGLRAQEAAGLSTDRPGISTSAGITPTRVFQLENGFEYYQNNFWQTYQLPTVLFRAGITQAAELRVGIQLTRQDSVRNGDRIATHWSTSALNVGTKVNLSKQKGWIPELSLVVELGLPYTTQANWKTAYIGHNVVLITTHAINPNLSICTNVGGAWEGDQTGAVFTYAASLGGKITAKTGYFIEHYAYWPEKAIVKPGLDAGIFHLLTPSIQVDLSAGVTQVNRLPNYFLATGLSFQVNTHSKFSSNRPHPGNHFVEQ